MTKRHYQLIIFDWDGTVMDSAAHIVRSAKLAIRDVGLPEVSAQKIRSLIGLSRHEILHHLFPNIQNSASVALEKAYEKHFFESDHMPVAPFEGAVEVLKTLANDYLLAVATGKSRRGLDCDLKDFNLGEYFVATRCGDEGFSKPHPQMLEIILDKTGMKPQDALMIGDSGYDLMMANQAKLDGLAVSYGVQTREELAQYEPIGFIDDIKELPAWLGK